jgi:hypothetical protein
MKQNSYQAIFCSLAVFLFIGCGQSNTSSSEDGNLDKDTTHVRTKIEPDQIQSVQKREVILDDSILGLFFGHFEPTSITGLLQERYDSMEAAIKTDEDYFTLEERFYNSSSDFEKNYFYKDPLYGVYALRKPNAISIHISTLTSDSIIGRSVCAGNERPLKMVSMTVKGDSTELILQEPGDDKYDGTFELILESSKGVLAGKFIPYFDKMPHKTLSTQNATFTYQPDGKEWAFDSDYFGKNISLEILNEEDVENQSKQRLRILRNIIYARHGYSFKNKDVREFFESYNWYVPISTDVRDQLTDIEKENIAMIKRYEAYAEDYYDDFGR